LQSANGTITARVGFLDSIALQGIEAKHVEVAITENLGTIDGLLGLSFLGRFNIKMDIKNGYIHLNR
jgi:predicted aspartyl protease